MGGCYIDKQLCQVYTCGGGVAIIGSSANVTFTSDDPGAMFNCKLNGKRISPCKHMTTAS